ncbi:DUF2955 domain-containing protein [Vibrio diabolicus]|uniref:DUF2955 domain-containing protein n=1 Tax=Vibrio diabolicus TaxID=50719 RepID=UPI00215FBF9B|nr:DUF2955 domain-containing protein [Vibrio diabolicus]MCS0438373.1 DUF2955 domain-containing protein [Vibrio diabolicus]MCZ0741423.1 DUF2955 domain-containing protein [Vibrio diabolicus]
MFHSSANPIIRLVFTPILLLFYLQYSGAPTPFIAPIFVVIFLTLMPSKPPFNMMLKLLVILSLLSFGIVTLAGALMSSPSGFLLFTWSLLCWSYYRSHRDPKDIVSTLTLIVVLIIVVTSQQMGLSLEGLPWVLFTSFIVALVATYISFWLFPGDEKDIQPDQTTLDGANEHIGLIVFKATALCVVLYALISSGSSQTLLIAITFGSMIKHPVNQDSHSFGRYRIITTSLGILFTIPCMLAVATGAPTYVVLGVTIFCGLQLACFAIRRQTHLTIYQLLFTNFTVLTYQIINNTGIESFSAQMTRFVSISIAIVLGGLVLNLFRSEQEVK